MRPKLYSFLFIALSIITFSCKTASKMYQKGNYDEAVELAAKKLQKKPNDPELISIIRESYRYAQQDHQSRISSLSSSNNELKWEQLYSEYASLQKMYDAIYKVSAVYELVHPVDYSDYLITYAEKAADVRFDRGLSFMEHAGDKQGYRQAYREFQVALQYKPEDRDILMKKDEAYEYAVTNIAVLPLQQNGGYVYSSYTVGGDNIDDKILRDLQFSSGNEFVKFYSSWDARSQHIRIDQEMEMQLVNTDIGRYHDASSKRRVSKEVVIKETVYKPDSIVREYGKVYAEITTTRRVLNSSAVLQITVRDNRGRWIWNDDIPASYQWSTEFSSFTGDERALSDADKQLVNRRKEFAPTEAEIMRIMTDQLTNDASSRLRSHFISNF